jgi:lactate racemase
MSVSDLQTVIGTGTAKSSLSTPQLRSIVEEGLKDVRPGQRVLAIIPDRTRDDNTDLLFPMAAQFLARRNVAQFDALVAQGTHGPMTESQKLAKIGLGSADVPGLGKIFDHHWDQEHELVTLGRLTSTHVSQLTDGLITEAVDVRLNALLTPGLYDTVLVFGATMPHEVAGFAGGAKYFFPGVAGPELTHMTHWLGALATIEQVIGRIETPTRRMIEAAALFVPAEIISFTSVNTRDVEGLKTHALFAGDINGALRSAAAVSAQVHIKYTGRKYARVLALLDEHYDELWVGGKASYKLGSVIETGGELVIYAPHLNKLSDTHGKLIEKYGYAPLETVRDMVEHSDELRSNLCVAAHLAHVSYGSAFDKKGQVKPRYRITLASGVSEEVCRRVRLGYVDYRSVRREEYENDPEALVVENAGRDLYLVEGEKLMGF